ncbi:isoeugenol monooxygenase [Zopfia rhizophila CBS 207.26]|uniref:Isoeugenol monooxygenase n=1 Tax=Zopfia rhizophila CBS 207.26 TaxID=1314779 RepID=A0A6A6DPX1_9PEZI|nr:isoeugenol monooxygenase [Zopfia rhizophila CBS 207.26]
MALPFPDVPFLSGFEEPCRFEGKVFDLVVNGFLPRSIDGTFFRVMPDPLLSPAYFQDGTHYIPFDGDGNVSAFRIRDGHVDFQQAYVQTERLKKEKSKRASMWGRYRNPFTAHPCVRAAIESTANTNVVFFNGKLLALKENGLPYAMNPDTLETLGYYDFEGQITSKTFTAHPKFDPKTGEMVCWGYEAKANATTDCCYFAFGKDGKKTEECWFKSPFCGFIHDAAMTDDYLILMLCPLVTDLERLKEKQTHWVYDYNLPVHFGVIPRRGSDPSKVRWFKWKNGFPTHTANATQVKGSNGGTKLIMDSVLVYGNALPFFPEVNVPENLKPENLKISMVRWEIDMLASSSIPTIKDPKILFDEVSEFPSIDDRFVSRAQKYIFCGVTIPDAVTPDGKSLVGLGALNALAKVDCQTGKAEICHVGPDTIVQEPVFAPRSKDAVEGDGFVICLVNRLDKMASDLIVVDTRSFADGPMAVVNLPFRLRQGLHGNWVDASDMA